MVSPYFRRISLFLSDCVQHTFASHFKRSCNLLFEDFSNSLFKSVFRFIARCGAGLESIPFGYGPSDTVLLSCHLLALMLLHRVSPKHSSALIISALTFWRSLHRVSYRVISTFMPYSPPSFLRRLLHTSNRLHVD